MGNEDAVSVRGILLDVTLDSPAKALWLQMKQFNGYSGCSKCKEKGCQHVIGIGKKGRNRQCHIYPYNTSSPSGHAEIRKHDEVKEQALQVLRRKKDGAKSVCKLLQIVFESMTNIVLVDRVSVVFPEVRILFKS